MSIVTKTIVCAALTLGTTTSVMAKEKFNYVTDRFADIEVLRYKVPGFEELSLKN